MEEDNQDDMLHQKFTFWIVICIGIIFILIVIHFVGNYLDTSLNLNITEEICYNSTENITMCFLKEVPELRKEIGDCNKYQNMSCVVEKDCGFNGTDFNYSNCKYYAYESIKKEDIDIEYLENNCELKRCTACEDLECKNKKCDLYYCFDRYIVEVN